MRNPLPGDFYRDIVRELCINFSSNENDIESDDEFYTYLDSSYRADKQALQEAGYVVGSPKSVSGVTNGMFVFAVGLFTYGRLDVVEDIVKRIPKTGNVRRLEFVINVLLPIPDNLEPMDDPGEFHRWLQENQQKLVWNKNKGLFEWKDTGFDSLMKDN